MKSILHQLYDGEIAPWEQFTPTLTDCRAKRQEHLRHYESLRRTLTEEQRKELEEVMDEQLALFPLEQAESFIKGFRLGAGIMMEVLLRLQNRSFLPRFPQSYKQNC